MLAAALAAAGCADEAPAPPEIVATALDAPAPRTPAHDARLRSGAPPRLSWTPAPAEGVHYEVELDRACGRGALAACDFARPALAVKVMTSTWQPDASDAASDAAIAGLADGA